MRVAGDAPHDVILDCWLPIATVAWEGFLRHGRGAVHLRSGGAGRYVLYRAGAFSRRQRKLIDTYDPERQVVVFIHDEEAEATMHVADGWPPPPQAPGITIADEVGETVH